MTIVELDKALTLTINSCHVPFWDNFFFIFSGQLIWLPFFAAVIYALYRQYGRRVYLPLIAFFLVILISDQISSSLIKPLVCRLRPTHDPEICAFIHTVNGYVGGLYGFVSSHAANSFSFALLSSLIFKRWGYSVMAFLWAAVTSYSRIYLGVHFLGDVIVGAAIGLVAAYAIYLLLVWIQRKADVVVNRADKFSIVLIYSVMVLTLIALAVLKEHLVFLA
ncbi:MAG: phosphatase PAP2 family protein [bacterium]|uniref:Phosphatase PAP2 family protein n=1 Tax=Candidatus Aphodosoma intestinipullorum TaxID=2840674 RepID=A0A940DHM5_9BACT|nr:phosphatase PAP2 family protein [Candidatus Aphodosoma intestinipullorum]